MSKTLARTIAHTGSFCLITEFEIYSHLMVHVKKNIYIYYAHTSVSKLNLCLRNMLINCLFFIIIKLIDLLYLVCIYNNGFVLVIVLYKLKCKVRINTKVDVDYFHHNICQKLNLEAHSSGFTCTCCWIHLNLTKKDIHLILSCVHCNFLKKKSSLSI